MIIQTTNVALVIYIYIYIYIYNWFIHSSMNLGQQEIN